MVYNCIIIEDEPLARKGLEEYIEAIDFLHLAGSYDNPLNATELLGTQKVHLIFLDIQMPAMSGIEFFRSLQDPPQVIFTTAYPDYAVEGFSLNALDYLVKPISFERFLTAANKARKYFHLTATAKSSDLPDTAAYFYIKDGQQLLKITWADFEYAEARQNYVCIHAAGKKYITYLTLKSIEEFLPSHRFIKTHKSFLIDASKIKSIEANVIRIGNYEIPISRNLKEQVMDQLLRGHFLKR